MNISQGCEKVLGSHMNDMEEQLDMCQRLNVVSDGHPIAALQVLEQHNTVESPRVEKGLRQGLGE